MIVISLMCEIRTTYHCHHSATRSRVSYDIVHGTTAQKKKNIPVISAMNCEWKSLQLLCIDSTVIWFPCFALHICVSIGARLLPRIFPLVDRHENNANCIFSNRRNWMETSPHDMYWCDESHWQMDYIDCVAGPAICEPNCSNNNKNVCHHIYWWHSIIDNHIRRTEPIQCESISKLPGSVQHFASAFRF